MDAGSGLKTPMCRWRVAGPTARSETYFVVIPQPQIVEDYFDGAQKIDVHNHYRQGDHGICLGDRPTRKWECRFLQCFLGTVEVDAYLAYKRFCPGKGGVTNSEFLRVLVDDLLNNTIGCAHGASVLRSRAGTPRGERDGAP